MKRKESKEAVRERVRKWREKQKGVTEKVTGNTIKVTKPSPGKANKLSAVTEDDIKLLPPSFRYSIDYVTNQRKVLNIPDNVKERTEAAVRRFRGY